ncbi:DUF2110 family protein [Halobacteriaceae archaeon GCM10025711]
MVVLATKLYVTGDARERALDGLRALVENDVGDLDVTFDVGVRHDDFPTVTVDGEDAVVARNALRERWGEITPDLEDGETYVGTLESWSDEGFVLDAGQDVLVPASELGLGPGTPAQIRERFGLVQHLRMEFVYGDTPRLSDGERDRLYDWQRGNGRVNVNSATRGEVRATVNRAGHAQDIVTVERLGLLEQSVVCAEGTDPPGLIASVGRHLPAELLAVIP